MEKKKNSLKISEDKESNWSDIADQDRLHVAEEHINPMPYFIMYPSVVHTEEDRKRNDNSDKDSGEESMVEIPTEKQMHFPTPKIMKLNHKPSASIHRSRSAHHKVDEAINEWEGGERQDIKIEKYTKCNIKKCKLANGKPREDYLVGVLKKREAEQEKLIEKLKGDYSILEKQLISQTETIQHCKKCVELEWDKRKDGMKIQLIEECKKNLEELLEERVKLAIQGRKEEINKIMTDLIASKLKSLL